MSSDPRRASNDEHEAMGEALRRLSAYTVLFNEAVADRLDITLTDLKCSSLLHLQGAMTAGALAEITGLTTGAITGVIDRLEKAKLARRVADPDDRRKVMVESLQQRAGEFERLYSGLGGAMGKLFAELDAKQLAAVHSFIVKTNTILLDEAKALRAGVRAAKRPAKKKASARSG
jgi:DNA-binding MarR family transcriptional regulator